MNAFQREWWLQFSGNYGISSQSETHAGLGTETAYMQQWRKLWRIHNVTCNPRSKFWVDLSRQIQLLSSHSGEIILMMDANADYAEVIEIDMSEIKEPILACPNDPDDAKFLSDVSGTAIDEVFIGSCMTNIGHFRAASKLLEGKRDIPVKLWMAPPTKMDASELTKEGHYGVFGAAGARMEMPGCSLCMGNQAQVREGATVVSTSTRNFPNRLGKNTNVYLASAEVAAISSKLGRIPTVAEYQESMTEINKDGSQIYKYMNFDKIEEYAEVAKGVAA